MLRTGPGRELDVVDQSRLPNRGCDEDEIAARTCIAVDGVTVINIPPLDARGDKPAAFEPLPMRIRPPSNYYWRSNPYEVNSEAPHGEGDRMVGGVDFRFAYWMGRWTR